MGGFAGRGAGKQRLEVGVLFFRIFEEFSPAGEHLGVEFGGGFLLPSGHEVVGGLRGEDVDQLGSLAIEEAFEFGLLFFGGGFGGFVGGDDRGFDERVFGDLTTFENAEEGVVVFCGDGIEFMIVTLGAADGEAEHGARRDIEAVVIVFADGLEAERGQVVAGHLVGGDLGFEEGVVGEVLIEGLDDPVAIAPGVGVGIVVAGTLLAVGIAGEIEPEAGPAFAVMGRGEEAVDNFGEGGGRAVGEEGGGFGGGGRETGEIEGDAAK